MNSAWDDHQLSIEHRPKLLQSSEESLFCKFSRFILEHPLSVKELVYDLRWVDDAKNLIYWDLLHPSSHVPHGLKVFLDSLGINADAYLMLTGQDYLGSHFDVLSDIGLCKALRFCPECLEFGFHSPIYQHWAMDRCPLHGVRLLDKCPYCRNPIKGKASFAIRDPLACPSCAKLLSHDWDSYHNRERLHEIRIVSMMIRDRKRDILWCQQPGIYVSQPVGLPKLRPDDLSAAATSVEAQRHLVWAPVPVGRWRSFRETEEKSYEQENKSFESSIEEIKSCTLSEFRRIYNLLGSLDAEIDQLFWRVGRVPTGARLVGYASVLSVAYCRMIYAYGFSSNPCTQEFVDIEPMLSIHSRLVRHFGENIGREQLIQQTIVADMRAMFAILLVECGKCRYLEDIAWNASPSPTQYQTAWCIHVNERSSAIRLRPRVSSEILARLVDRYRNRFLIYKYI